MVKMRLDTGVLRFSWTLGLLGLFRLKNYCSSPLILRQEEFKISSSFAAWPAENYEVLVAWIIFKRIDASGMLNWLHTLEEMRSAISKTWKHCPLCRQVPVKFSSNFFTPQLFLSMLSFQVLAALLYCYCRLERNCMLIYMHTDFISVLLSKWTRKTWEVCVVRR